MPNIQILCPHCHQTFDWDGLGTHDECPNFGCKKQVKCTENFATPEAERDYDYYLRYRKRLMQGLI